MLEGLLVVHNSNCWLVSIVSTKEAQKIRNQFLQDKVRVSLDMYVINIKMLPKIEARINIPKLD